MKKHTVRIDPARCKGCGLCVAFCSSKNLRISAEITPAGMHPAEKCEGTDCNGCRLCVLMCPDVAISLYRQVEEVTEDK